MYNLNKSIQNWKQQALRSGLDPSAADELECHLRDTIDDLVANGSPAEDAFAAAVERLGEANAIAREFDKIDSILLPDRIALTALGSLGILLTVGLFWNVFANRVGVENLYPIFHVVPLTLGYLILFFVFWLGGYCAIRRFFTMNSETLLFRCLQRMLLPLSVIGLLLSISGVVMGCVLMKQMHGSAWSWDVREVGGLLLTFWFGSTLVILWRNHGVFSRLPFLLLSAGVVAHFGWFVISGMGVSVVSLVVALIVGLLCVLAFFQNGKERGKEWA